jgi:hypothetical protein
MESSLQISLVDRLRVAGRAIRGVFKQPTPQDLLGVYAGLFPGGPGSPPPRGMAELIKSYADMPWLHAVAGGGCQWLPSKADPQKTVLWTCGYHVRST